MYLWLSIAWTPYRVQCYTLVKVYWYLATQPTVEGFKDLSEVESLRVQSLWLHKESLRAYYCPKRTSALNTRSLYVWRHVRRKSLRSRCEGWRWCSCMAKAELLVYQSFIPGVSATMLLPNIYINSDWMSNASPCVCVIYADLGVCSFQLVNTSSQLQLTSVFEN